jgi:hypothetical protein
MEVGGDADVPWSDLKVEADVVSGHHHLWGLVW